MSYSDKMTSEWEIIHGGDDRRITNGYRAEGRCPNCHDGVSIIVRTGLLLSSITVPCELCKAANYVVTPLL